MQVVYDKSERTKNKSHGKIFTFYNPVNEKRSNCVIIYNMFLQKNYKTVNKFLFCVALTWAVSFIYIVKFEIILPWLDGDYQFIAQFITFVFSITGLFISSISSYLSIWLLKRNPSSLLGILFLYLNLIAVLFSLFGVIILDFIDTIYYMYVV